MSLDALLRHAPDQPLRLPLYFLGVTALAEGLILAADPRLGLFLHFGLILLLLYNVLEAPQEAVRRFYLAMLLIPMIRILSLGLPLAAWPQLSWYFVIAIPLSLAVLLVIRQEEWRRDEIGLTFHDLPVQLGIGVTGLALGWIEYKILSPGPLIRSFSPQAIWLPTLVLLISTGFLEELIFRGLLQSAALPVLEYWPALVYIAALFAVMHIGNASIIDVVFVFLVGLLFGVIVARTRSILGVALAHGLTNISLFLVWPFLLGLNP